MKEERTMILFEGNIAAGKSTLGEELARSGKFGFVPEPVDQWQNFRLPSSRKATNLLKLFYKDQERWAFTFQLGRVRHAGQDLDGNPGARQSPDGGPRAFHFLRPLCLCPELLSERTDGGVGMANLLPNVGFHQFPELVRPS